MSSFRFLAVYKVEAFIIFLLSVVSFLPPLFYSLFVEDGEILSFLVPFSISLLLFSLSVPIKTYQLTEKEALFVSVSIWFLFPLFAALCYLISEYITDPIDAYFEAVSGFTTTGASILTDIEKLPPSVLMFRNLTNWVGGLGFVVFAVSFLSTKLPIGRAIVKFESSKVIEEKIEPRVKEVAKIIIAVYISLTVLEILILKILGVSWYNSITYTFATVATGGFAPKNASAGIFNSPAIETVIGIFMILGAINLQLYYISFKKKSIKRFFVDEEVRVFLGIIAFSSLFSAFILYENGYYNNFLESLRYAFFQISSAATTTGFSSTDYSNWHSAVLSLMLIVALIGAVGGSTGGGIKIYRLIFIYQTVKGEIKKLAHSNIVYRLSVKGKPVDINKTNMFWAFLSVYLFSTVFFGFILTVGGHDLITSFSASIACITSLGPGLGDVGPASNFSSLSDFEKLSLSFEMIFGRLEIIPVISLLFLKNL